MKSDLIFLACKIGSSMTASDASVPLLVKPIGRLQTSLSSTGSLRECAVLPNGKSGNDIRQTRAFCVNPGTSEIGRSSIESTCISGEQIKFDILLSDVELDVRRLFEDIPRFSVK
ncbi:hypothetical protein RB195_002217 [Necator americanus]|uniref:Uncharacterized protein n=1 Tax=Necator americanus TaxID=51031 RepID=A0ABR1DIQ6_NECAM